MPKKQIQTYVHFWDVANKLFLITLSITDVTHLK